MGRLNMPPQTMMTIRFLIGAYLLYADYSVYDDVLLMTGGKKIGFIIVMVIFLLAGLALMIGSAIGLYRSWADERNNNDPSSLESEDAKEEER